jgi:hypothetical protein
MMRQHRRAEADRDILRHDPGLSDFGDGGLLKEWRTRRAIGKIVLEEFGLIRKNIQDFKLVDVCRLNRQALPMQCFFLPGRGR